MSSLPLRVIKMGGSLLENRHSAERILQWLRGQSAGRFLAIVGGGPPVDAIRHMASLYDYDVEFLHWLCVDAMDISFRMAAEQLRSAAWQKIDPVWQVIRDCAELHCWLNQPQSNHALVHVQAFYTQSNYRELPVALPLNWSTTSDSLAALLAHIVAADELVLLKSCRVPEPYDWKELARCGIVDQAFPQAAIGLKKVQLATP